MSESRPERIVFGSLEKVARERLESGSHAAARPPSPPGPSPAPAPPETQETAVFSERAQESQEKHKKLLDQLELQKRARGISVPTKDKDVRSRLRELNEPITLFGEGPAERRTRLRELIARMGLDNATPASEFYKDWEKGDEEQQFYYEGPPELRTARLLIARYSLARAKERIKMQRRVREEEEAKEMILDPELLKEQMKQENAPDPLSILYDRVKTYENSFSEVGDERTLSSCAISPDGKRVATASWTGLIKVWDRSTCKLAHVLKGHRERTLGIAWHPEASGTATPMEVDSGGGGGGSGTCALASGSHDYTVRLWSAGGQQLAMLEGHTDRVNRVAFHPMGRHVGSTSWDLTWRLFDIETQKCLLTQEGHSRVVYGISFQCDGSLAATAGADAIGRVWDIRLGQSVVVLQGHVKEVAAVDFHPNGFQLATGSEDHSVRIWDLRRQKCIYTIPAHQSLVSHIRFQPRDGNFLLTAGFDNVAKLWTTRPGETPVLLKIFPAHDAKVSCVDVAQDSSYFVTSSFDRTWKLWAPPERKEGANS